ncbi:MAG: YggT family protein [Dehalococcoidia bacterium]|nr:YggT family protein [Dehalococcoidia bacterium]
MYEIAGLLALFLQILTFAIFFRSLATWFPIDQNGPVLQVLNALTDPVLGPLRRVVPAIGMIDLTPMVAIILLQVLAQALQRGAIV